MALSSAELITAQRWHQLAGQTRTRINVAWWWQGAGPVLAGLAGIGCAVVLYLRSTLETFDVTLAASILAGAFLLAVLGVWLWARRRFVTMDVGLVQLEDHLRLKNRLTSAAAGVGTWPELPVLPEGITDGLLWRRAAVWPPVLVIAGCLALALFLPITPPEIVAAPPIAPPSATQETERLLQALEKSESVREQDLEQFKKALTSLQKQAPEKWYSHSSLEAADHLKETLSRAATDLGQNYQKVAKSLDKLGKDSGASPAAREQAGKELQAAMEGLKNGGLQPNEELLQKLKELDPAQLEQQLSKEELEQLKQALKENQKALQEALKGKGEGQGEGEGQTDEEKAMREALKNGQEGAEGDQKEGQEGAGEPDRGPGTVDLKMHRKEKDLGTDNPEQERTKDFKRLTPGELLGTSDGEHEVDKSADGTTTSEGTSALGSGGDAVRKESLLPEEKRVLRKYFK